MAKHGIKISCQTGSPQPLRPRLDRLPIRLDFRPDCRGILLPLCLLGGPRLRPVHGCAAEQKEARLEGRALEVGAVRLGAMTALPSCNASAAA